MLKFNTRINILRQWNRCLKFFVRILGFLLLTLFLVSIYIIIFKQNNNILFNLAIGLINSGIFYFFTVFIPTFKRKLYFKFKIASLIDNIYTDSICIANKLHGILGEQEDINSIDDKKLDSFKPILQKIYDDGDVMRVIEYLRYNQEVSLRTQSTSKELIQNYREYLINEKALYALQEIIDAVNMLNCQLDSSIITMYNTRQSIEYYLNYYFSDFKRYVKCVDDLKKYYNEEKVRINFILHSH